MRAGSIDVVTIFPEFFSSLEVSLIGKARDSGTLGINVHDLRRWTTDARRTVDDTPAGGGAGMVMKPDVWGSALDDVLGGPDATLIIPTPGGAPFTQAMAEGLARDLGEGAQVVIACGRYEGIDSRVPAHYAHKVRVLEVSIGDYVLNGGESAAMVMIEAIARLVPGVVGNPDSLVEESHGEDGLLEYPVYTVPQTWRDLQIPAILRSGDHGKIAQWRRARALERTARVRPDLLEGRAVLVRRAKRSDASRLHEVAGRTFVLAGPPDFDPVVAREFVEENLSLEQFRTWAKDRSTQLWVVEILGVVIGYATVLLRYTSKDLAGQERATTSHLSKFYILPEHHGAGIASELMAHVFEGARKAGMTSMWLGVNQLNTRAKRFYEKNGFVVGATRTFEVAGDVHEDFVMTRTLDFSSE